VSVLGFGGILIMNGEQAGADRLVAGAVERGVNYFDVAPTYGDAQEKLGRSLQPYRKDVYLACKTTRRRRETSRKELEESFRLLRTDYFDNYQLHALTTKEDIDAAFGPDGVMETLVRAKEKGLVRKLGITCHGEDAAVEALTLFPFDTVLFPLNWGLHLGKDFGTRIAKLAREKNAGLLALKSLVHRAWLDDAERNASRFPKSWCKPISDNDALGAAAMKYTLSLGAHALIPPGNIESFTFALNHIDECLANPLSVADLEYLKKALKEIDGKYFF